MSLTVKKCREILKHTYPKTASQDINASVKRTAKAHGVKEKLVWQCLAAEYEVKKPPKQKVKKVSYKKQSREKSSTSTVKTGEIHRPPKPPFSWAGGKGRMIAHYKDIFFPPGEIKIFVDMFCGATTMARWIRKNFPKTKIVLNDFNKELMDMYTVIRNQYPAFEKEYKKIIAKIPKSPEERKKYYYKIRDVYGLKWKSQSKAKLAAMLFFMLKTNFNGLWVTRKKLGGRYGTSPGTMTFAPKFLELEPIRKFSNFLKQCELRCGDFGALGKYAKKGTYYYADPPYRSTDVLYQGGFDDKEQQRLAEFLKKMDAKGAWVAESNREIGDKFWNKAFSEKKYKKHYVRDVKFTVGRGESMNKFDEVLITNF